VNLINPTTLRSILQNISLHLREGYELIAGTRAENIHLYYNLITVTVLGNVHSVKIVIHVPLKTVDRLFTIYKLFVFPTRISDNKFVKYAIEFPYFGLSVDQHVFIFLTEADLSHCKTNGITVCPANVAIYNSQTLNRESTLFFQSVANQHMCRRSLHLNHQTPTLRRHKTTWLYHLPESSHITLRRYVNTQWITYTETLSGNGIITNATRCSVSTTQMHTLSELHKTSEATLHTLHLYVPEKISIVTDHEKQILVKLSPKLIQQLDGVNSRVMATPRNLDVDKIVHARHVSLQQERQSYWNLIVITTVCSITLIGILCFSLRSHIYRQILPCFPTRKPPYPHTELQVIPAPSTPNPETSVATNIDLQKNVIFATYSLKKATSKV